MATRLEKLFWSILSGTALGIMGCEKNDPGEDGMADAYGPPVDASVEETADAADVPDDIDTEVPATEYGPPADV